VFLVVASASEELKPESAENSNSYVCAPLTAFHENAGSVSTAMPSAGPVRTGATGAVAAEPAKTSTSAREARTMRRWTDT
jgi:hypothetical protein